MAMQEDQQTVEPRQWQHARGHRSNTNSVHQSAKMRDAQSAFQRVVKHELQALLASGMDRSIAVKQLLHRIVECTEEPPEADVQRVMKQFQMHHDDAVRALIVKQEIGRLKSQGMDAFAAIEELTRKMQRTCPSPGIAEDEAQLSEADKSVDDESEVGGASNSSPMVESVICPRDSIAEGIPEEREARTFDTQRQAEPSEQSSLSLCQRIGKVSISSQVPSRSGSQCARGESNRKRKDRATTEEDDRVVKEGRDSEVTPLSSFASSKRQKLCLEIGDNLLCMVSNARAPSVSPQAGSARSAINHLKRQRPESIPSSPSSEDDLLDANAIIRHAKRHRT